MADYIKREDAIKEIAEQMAFEASMETGMDYMGADYIDDAKKWLSGCLSIDVAPVRHGHWIEEQDRIVCSECGARFRDEIIYMQENKPGAPHRCLECGAIMDKEVPTNG